MKISYFLMVLLGVYFFSIQAKANAVIAGKEDLVKCEQNLSRDFVEVHSDGPNLDEDLSVNITPQ